MIGTGPCCQLPLAVVAWRTTVDDPTATGNSPVRNCVGAVPLAYIAGHHPTAPSAEPTIWQAGGVALEVLAGGPATWAWHGFFGVRVDPTSGLIRAGYWALDGDAGFVFALTAEHFDDYPDGELWPTNRVLFEWTGAAWNRVGAVGYDRFDAMRAFEPAGFWATDGNGEPLAGALGLGAVAAFPLARADLEAGSVRVTVATAVGAIVETLAFVARTDAAPLGGFARSTYRFQASGTFASDVTPAPPLAELGAFPVVVTLDVSYQGCALQPYLATLAVESPGYYADLALVARSAQTVAVSTWLPSGEWLEFAYQGTPLANTIAVVYDVSALLLGFPSSLTVPVAHTPVDLIGVNNLFGAQGLNWPNHGIVGYPLAYRKARVTGLTKP